ncbi:hypothetical protein [Nostoc sp.]|uniref:hypothetical protein n=1 Tax=Nostoc sp. TaxID=1180 RepID=UPI002FFD0F84
MPVITSTPVTEDEKSTTNFHLPLWMFLLKLWEFRQAGYECLYRAKDATFELMDAILHPRNVYSLGDLSMCPVFRRQWSSIYEAIQDTRPQRHKLMGLYSKNIPKQERIILTGDHTIRVKT